ncbi:hypothetical protein [uncultured Modestobacter sp.]|nr:hypothetical protein [uncultured Modestobacter sp.]
MSDCCSPSGCNAPATATGQPVALPVGVPDRRNRAERRRDARQSKR